MKIIKHLFIAFTIVLLLIIVGTMIAAPRIFAQTQERLVVAAIPYKPMQNLDFFFLHSVHPLYFIEAENEEGMSHFVAMITLEQKSDYEKAGYKPVVIDKQAGEIEQYYIMSTHHHKKPNIANQLQNPAYKKQGLELAYQLETYTTLIKVSKGTSFSQLPISLLSPFNARQLHWALVPPTGRVSADLPQKLAQMQTNTTSTATQKWFLISGISILILILVCLYVVLSKRR